MNAAARVVDVLDIATPTAIELVDSIDVAGASPSRQLGAPANSVAVHGAISPSRSKRTRRLTRVS